MSIAVDGSAVTRLLSESSATKTPSRPAGASVATHADWRGDHRISPRLMRMTHTMDEATVGESAITPGDAYQRLARQKPDKVAYLSLEDQRRLPYETSAAMPERHFGRKNVGYVYAAHAGASACSPT